jgi:hypothetical protein
MQKLLDSGQTLLYRAPSHTGIFLASFLGCGGMVFGALVTFDNKQWRRQPGLPWWSTFANITGIMAMGGLSAFCYWRGARLISSISVTARTADEVPVLLVKVRRYVPLPFVPPREIVVDPAKFVLPRDMVSQIGVPRWAREESTDKSRSLLVQMIKRVQRSTFDVFAGMRKMLTREGIVRVSMTCRRATVVFSSVALTFPCSGPDR